MPALTVGQLVSVPWGLDELEGTVLRIYDTGIGQRVVVAVRVPGADEDGEDTTLTLPADAVEPIDKISHRPQPGAWVSAHAYERDVANAIRRIVSRTTQNAEVSESAADQGADLVVHSDQSTVVVETKYTSSRSRLSAKEIDRALMIASRTSAPFMLVTNVSLAPSAFSRFHEGGVPKKFSLVKWRGPEDDASLESELRLLLS
jgi:hypothetical protein